jgi:hypothetical protein
MVSGKSETSAQVLQLSSYLPCAYLVGKLVALNLFLFGIPSCTEKIPWIQSFDLRMQCNAKRRALLSHSSLPHGVL